MSLDHRVTTVEISRRLYEQGVPQESSYYWTHNAADNWDLTSNPAQAFIDSDQCFSAFTVEELASIILSLIGGEPPDRRGGQP
jgi:hypothetical protein